MDARNVLGDTFKACVIASISYRVYALRDLPDLASQPELVFGSSLRKAEVFMRKRLYQCRNNIYISTSHTGKDLWVYEIHCLDGRGPPFDMGASSKDQKCPEPDPPSPGQGLKSPGSGSKLPELDPANGSLDLSTIDEWLRAVMPAIETEAQGVFLPPFTNTTISSSQYISGASSVVNRPSDDARYGPLLRAIELRCLDALLKNGDHEQYEAFGYRAALGTGDGSVIRMKPNLSQEGNLSLRMCCKKAALIPFPVSNIHSCATLVWLLPHGKPCRVLSSLRLVSSVEPPNAARARALHRILTTYFVTNITLPQLEKSMWLRVSSADAGDMLWPAVLIRATALTTGGCESTHGNNIADLAKSRQDSSEFQLPNSSLSVQDMSTVSLVTRPLVKLSKPDPYAALDDVMASIRQEMAAGNGAAGQANPDTGAAAGQLLRHTVPIPPPSSPRATASSASYADMRALASRDTTPRLPSLRQASEPSLRFTMGGTTVPSVAVTPGVPTPGRVPTPGSIATPQSVPVYPTPAYHTPGFYTPGYPTPSAPTPGSNRENWMDVEEGEEDVEVGDADFNFFDLPVHGEERHAEIGPPGAAAATMAGEDIPLLLGLPDQQLIPDPSIQAISAGSKRRAVSADNIQWLGRTRFASLDFYTLDMDSKYSSGGRFYVKPREPEEEEAGKAKSEEEDRVVEVDRVSSSDDDSSSENGDNGSDSSDFLVDDEGSDVEAHSQFTFSQPPAFTSEDVESAWFRSIKFEEAEYHPVDNSKFVCFRQLIPQIVWDSGMLQEIGEAPIIRGEELVAPQYAVERVKVVFMDLTQCSIVHSMKSGSDPVSSELFPLPGDPATSLPSPANSSSPTSFQLFSPPLVAVKRGEYMLRARISILRFWRLLGLEPPEIKQSSIRELPSSSSHADRGADTSMSVILITLASPALVDGARRILTALSEAYEGCRLGSIHLPTFGDIDRGLMTIHADLNHTAGDTVGDLYENACTQLRAKLMSGEHTGKTLSNLLIMVCYPPSSLRGGTLTAIVPFQIAQGISELQSSLPNCQWLLSSLDLLVSRWDHDKDISTFEMERIAHLAYSRFPHFPKAFRLAALAPKASGLQFTVEQPQFLMEDEPVLHVAYLLGKSRWCLVSWSDQWAQTTHVDIFKLSDSSERALQTLFSEIWSHSVQVSRDIKDHGTWRFCITKCGPMPLYEKEVWSKAIAPSAPVVLMDTPHPSGLGSEQVVEGMHQRTASLSPNHPMAQSSTPSRSASASTSPPQTPDSRAEYPPSDSVIIDETDVVYGASIGIPLPLVSGFVNAAAKGFLIRQQSEHITILEVRLLVLNEFKIPARTVMSRVVGQFRRLASLAEYTGVTVESTMIPWHILALIKLESAALKLNMF